MPGKSLFSLGREVLLLFKSVNNHASSHSTNLPGESAALDIKLEGQRFRLWATNLGLCLKGDSSLDYRLRDAENVQRFIKDILVDLSDSLSQLLQIARGDRVPYDTMTEDEMSAAVNDNMSLFGSGSSNASNDNRDRDRHDGAGEFMLTGELSTTAQTEVEARMRDTVDSIDRLYKMANKIRSPDTRVVPTDFDLYRHIDATDRDLYIKQREDGYRSGVREYIRQCRSRGIENASIRTEEVLTDEDEDKYLINRLHMANQARRRQFAYWEHHKDKLIQASSAVMGEDSSNDALATMISKDVHQPQPETSTLGERTFSTYKEPTFLSMPSAATELPAAFQFEDSKSSKSDFSRASTVYPAGAEAVDWPSLPPNVISGKDFECPFCFFICPAAYQQRRVWRSHIRRDLRPYVCTYQLCRTGDQLYDTREDWTAHEASHHRSGWQCASHTGIFFEEESSYVEHMSHMHNDLSSTSTDPELIAARRSVRRIPERPCPFCLCKIDTNAEMEAHVAAHLEVIAVWALPDIEGPGNESTGDDASSDLKRLEQGQNVDLGSGDGNEALDDRGKADSHFNLIQLNQQLKWSPGDFVELKLTEENRQILTKMSFKKSPTDIAEVQVYLFDHAVLMVRVKNVSKREETRVYRKPIPLELLIIGGMGEVISKLSFTKRALSSFIPGTKPPTSTGPGQKEVYPITFRHLGKGGYELQLYATTVTQRKNFIEKVEEQQRLLRERNGNFYQKTILCENFFNANNRVNCLVLTDGGRKLVYGTDNGIYLADRWPKDESIKPTRILDAHQVSQIDILEEHKLLLVLSNKALTFYPFEALEANNQNPLTIRPRKIQGHVNFFKAGICLGRHLVCSVKTSALSTTIKVYEPIVDLTKGKKEPAISKKLVSGQDAFKPFNEFYIPAEVFSVHYLRSTLCLGGASGFEVVSLETMERQDLLDQTDTSLDFVTREENVKPIHIERLNGEFLLSYSDFSFFVQRNGWRARPDWKIQWEGTPQAFALNYPYIFAFEPSFIEIRHIETSKLIHVITGKHVRMLHSSTREILYAYEDKSGEHVIASLGFWSEGTQT